MFSRRLRFVVRVRCTTHATFAGWTHGTVILTNMQGVCIHAAYRATANYSKKLKYSADRTVIDLFYLTLGTTLSQTTVGSLASSFCMSYVHTV
jgi:hypothetical protein